LLRGTNAVTAVTVPKGYQNCNRKHRITRYYIPSVAYQEAAKACGLVVKCNTANTSQNAKWCCMVLSPCAKTIRLTLKYYCISALILNFSFRQ